jgi:hypothetical protein
MSQRQDQARLYSHRAVLALVAFCGSLPLVFAVKATDLRPLLFLTVLAIPIFFVLWIVLTIRAIHSIDLYFWNMSSTYIAGACLLGMLIVLVALGLALNGHPDDIQVGLTLLLSGLVVFGMAAYVFIRNYYATNLYSLAFSLTVLQFIGVAAIVFLILSWLSPDPKKSRQ